MCVELLRLIDIQTKTIARQNKLIAELANENFEQENFINELTKERVDDVPLTEKR
jgi:hypothetical protein